ncbi:hypothetical protein A4G99_00605 [Haladaptatus sp. R4]|nr:hypothetical protein A4G99_00605 [Haladaptatus sp. R4]
MQWLKRRLSSDEREMSERREESEQEEREGRWTMEEFAFETGRTPEVHVTELLAARDGEMRQQEIITETGWSRSSVSRLLCGMEADGEVVRVRLGTENVVYLPGSIPELVRDFESVPVAHA